MKKINVVKQVAKEIYLWVEENYGSQEAEDPSWNINELAYCVCEKFDIKIKGEEVK